MSQVCRVCAHRDTIRIEQDIVQGKPHTQIGKKYGIHFQSVRYHAENHLPEKLVRAVQEKEAVHTENILDGISDLLTRTKGILDKAEEQGHNRLALEAIREARGTYELLSRIAAKMEEFRRQDKEDKDEAAYNHLQDGLEALSDDELKTFIQLMGKIHKADPNHEIDPTSRLVVEAMTTVQPTTIKQEDLTQTRSRQPKSSQNQGGSGVTDINDEDDFWDDDLDLDLGDIPSGDTDPEWLRRDREQYGL